MKTAKYRTGEEQDERVVDLTVKKIKKINKPVSKQSVFDEALEIGLTTLEKKYTD